MDDWNGNVAFRFMFWTYGGGCDISVLDSGDERVGGEGRVGMSCEKRRDGWDRG